MLYLAGIPLKSRDRTEGHPLIIAGGPCAYNPEPIHEFIDLFVIGEGEEACVELIQLYQAWKRRHTGKNGDRQDLLYELARQIPGVYVPRFYEVKYCEDSTIKSINATTSGIPAVVHKRLVRNLDEVTFPTNPIVPFMEIVHDRVELELMRGCTRGCRFCQAGVIYRPRREKQLASLLAQAAKLIKTTGYEEIALLALSACDYSQIELLVDMLASELQTTKTAISLPSLRIDSFSQKLADKIKHIKKTGLTLVPEAGTQRLRNLINKDVTEANLMHSLEDAFELGWTKIKLYFMVGLPTECNEDLDGIAKLINKATKAHPAGRAVRINVSVSAFIPKPHTPFQWLPQSSKSELQEKRNYLKRRLNPLRNVHVSYPDVERSFLEGVFARGDRRLAPVLIDAWRLGCKFDAWSECFQAGLWHQAFAKNPIVNPTFYVTRARKFSEKLPWGHLSTGLSKDFLEEEYGRAMSGRTTGDCRDAGCHNCGVCTLYQLEQKPRRPKKVMPTTIATPKQIAQKLNKCRIRAKYNKGETLKFISHLDLVRLFNRALRRSGLPVSFSQGYNPQPRVSFSHALAVGITSEAEYADFLLGEHIALDEFKEHLNRVLPVGIEILALKAMPPNAQSLETLINVQDYEIQLAYCAKARNSPLVLVDKIMDATRLELTKKTKSGNIKRIDVKKCILNLDESRSSEAETRLSVSLLINNTVKVKPQELVEAINIHLTGSQVRIKRLHRLGQFVKIDSKWVSPFEVVNLQR